MSWVPKHFALSPTLAALLVDSSFSWSFHWWVDPICFHYDLCLKPWSERSCFSKDNKWTFLYFQIHGVSGKWIMKIKIIEEEIQELNPHHWLSDLGSKHQPMFSLGSTNLSLFCCIHFYLACLGHSFWLSMGAARTWRSNRTRGVRKIKKYERPRNWKVPLKTPGSLGTDMVLFYFSNNSWHNHVLCPVWSAVLWNIFPRTFHKHFTS